MTVGEIIDAFAGVPRDTELILYNYDDDLVKVKTIRKGIFGVLKPEYKDSGNYREIIDKSDMDAIETGSDTPKILITY